MKTAGAMARGFPSGSAVCNTLFIRFSAQCTAREMEFHDKPFGAEAATDGIISAFDKRQSVMTGFQCRRAGKVTRNSQLTI
jgi:hypothetical protein